MYFAFARSVVKLWSILFLVFSHFRIFLRVVMLKFFSRRCFARITKIIIYIYYNKSYSFYKYKISIHLNFKKYYLSNSFRRNWPIHYHSGKICFMPLKFEKIIWIWRYNSTCSILWFIFIIIILNKYIYVSKIYYLCNTFTTHQQRRFK